MVLIGTSVFGRILAYGEHVGTSVKEACEIILGKTGFSNEICKESDTSQKIVVFIRGIHNSINWKLDW